MYWEFTLLFVVLAIGVAVGVFIGHKQSVANGTHGNLNVDCSDPAYEPYLYLELSVPIAEVADRKRVTFNVNVISNNSQK